MWFRIASHLHKSVVEAKRVISPTEFNMWWAYLEKEVNFFHREDYFFAKLMATMVQCMTTKSSNVKIEDFLIKFTSAEEEMKVQQKQQEEKAKKSKQFWLGKLGIKVKG